jgi:ribosomal protein S7
MPRRRVVAKRDTLPDPKYGNVTLAKFMNHVMISGKKSVAERIIYGAMDIVKTKLNRDPLEVFSEALENIAPLVEVKSRRVGGATYQVPVEVRASRRTALAMRWLVVSLWMLRKVRALRLRSVKTFTAWLKRTRRSRTSVSNRGVASNILCKVKAARLPLLYVANRNRR